MSQPINKPSPKRKYNQYTLQTTPQEFVADLLQHRVQNVYDTHNIFKCMRPTGVGVHTLTSGYKRTNFRGRKVMVHKLVHRVWSGPTTGDSFDCSHLCGHEWCCNPKHLHSEPRHLNLSRRGCRAYVNVQGRWFKVCKHTPSCMTTASATPLQDLPREDG